MTMATIADREGLAMPDFLNEVIDEAATLIGEIAVIHRQIKRGQKMTQGQLDRLTGC
jgi:hypothetical protein